MTATFSVLFFFLTCGWRCFASDRSMFHRVRDADLVPAPHPGSRHPEPVSARTKGILLAWPLNDLQAQPGARIAGLQSAFDDGTRFVGRHGQPGTNAMTMTIFGGLLISFSNGSVQSKRGKD